MESVKIDKNLIKSKIPSLHPPTLKDLDREEIRVYFKNSWQLYEMLFSSIKNDSTYYLSPDPLRNPLIFYFGHTAAFYINKFLISGFIDKGINPYFEDVFAKGVDPENPEDLDASELWPSVQEVRQYRENVYNVVMNIIDQVLIPDQVLSTHPIWALFMGIEHDRIHFETSSVLIRQLDIDLVQKPENWTYAPSSGKNVENSWIHVHEGNVNLGKHEPSDFYGWDNEYGRQQSKVKPFYASKNLISNGDYLEFVQSGAYNDSKFWCKEGLKWKTKTNSEHPKFWIPQDPHKFAYRAMFDVLELPIDWPIEVNKFEALAYISYKNKNCRLLTEAEFKLMTKNEYNTKEPLFNNEINLNLKFGSPSPVGYFSTENNRFNDLFGNVWDWLDDNFDGLLGFKTHPWYEDFSQPYFDDKHSILLGGAWATTGTGASKYYRLWFRNYFYQHAGFRLAKNIE